MYNNPQQDQRPMGLSIRHIIVIVLTTGISMFLLFRTINILINKRIEQHIEQYHKPSNKQ